MKKNPYILRCYARPEKDHVIAVCVDLDLAIRADSIDSAKEELSQSIQSYLESLNKDNIKDLFPRPAPLGVRMDYYFVCCFVYAMRAIKNLRSGFDIFCELATPQSFRVTLCV